MRFLFLLDPLDRVIPPADTSLLLLKECNRRGINVFSAEHAHLGVYNGNPTVRSILTKLGRKGEPVGVGGRKTESVAEFDAVLFRKDPPFDLDYLHATQIVELAPDVVALNSPAGLRKANEKLYALNFSEAMPETLITRDRDEALAFLGEMKIIVAKPLDSFGGIGVVLVKDGDKGARALVDLITQEGRVQALFQRFIKGEDKRVFVIDGRVAGVMMRKGVTTDFRANMHVGGQPVLSKLTKPEQKRLEPVLELLPRDGLDFVGLDLIGGYLSEVNVTSPTGFWHYEKVSRRNLSKEVVNLLLSRIR